MESTTTTRTREAALLSRAFEAVTGWRAGVDLQGRGHSCVLVAQPAAFRGGAIADVVMSCRVEANGASDSLVPGLALVDRRNPYHSLGDAAGEFNRAAMAHEGRRRGLERPRGRGGPRPRRRACRPWRPSRRSDRRARRRTPAGDRSQ